MLIAGETSDVTSSIKVTSLPSNVSEDLITNFLKTLKGVEGEMWNMLPMMKQRKPP